MRENRECVLAGSRRGGRRIRKPKPTVENTAEKSNSQANSPAKPETPKETTNGEDRKAREAFNPQWQPSWQGVDHNTEAYSQYDPSSNVNPAVDKAIASADIQNPSDALEILAQVAGDAGNVDHVSSTAAAPDLIEESNPLGRGNSADNCTLFSFPPLASGTMTIGSINELLGM